MVWESIMAIQSKWQETHFLYFVWDEIAFCNSRCNILILQSGLTVLVSPALAVAFFEAKLLFVVRIAGIIKMSPKPRPETKQCIYVM